MDNKKLSTTDLASEVKRLRLEIELHKLQKEDARRKRLEKFNARLKNLGRFNIRRPWFFNLTSLIKLLWIALSLLGFSVAAVAVFSLYDQYERYQSQQEIHRQHEGSLRRYESPYAYEQATQQALSYAENLCKELHSEKKGKEYLTCISTERNKYLDKQNHR